MSDWIVDLVSNREDLDVGLFNSDNFKIESIGEFYHLSNDDCVGICFENKIKIKSFLQILCEILILEGNRIEFGLDYKYEYNNDLKIVCFDYYKGKRYPLLDELTINEVCEIVDLIKKALEL